jgi:hypothetical protein
MVQVKTPYRAKSIMIKRYENPEELPGINRKNIISLMNMTKRRPTILREKFQSLHDLAAPQHRSINVRIKKIKG